MSLFFLDPEFDGLPRINGSRLSNIFSFSFSKNFESLSFKKLVIPLDGILKSYLNEVEFFTVIPRSFSVIAELFLNSSEAINSLYNFGFCFFKDSSNIALYKSSPS